MDLSRRRGIISSSSCIFITLTDYLTIKVLTQNPSKSTTDDFNNPMYTYSLRKNLNTKPNTEIQETSVKTLKDRKNLIRENTEPTPTVAMFILELFVY